MQFVCSFAFWPTRLAFYLLILHLEWPAGASRAQSAFAHLLAHFECAVLILQSAGWLSMYCLACQVAESFFRWHVPALLTSGLHFCIQSLSELVQVPGLLEVVSACLVS